MNDRKWQPRKILFIGTYAGKQYFEQLVFEKKYIQLAANQTEKYYIEELSNLKLPLCVLSGLVTNGAPVKDLFVKKNVEEENGYIVSNVGFLNIPYVSVASQNISIRKEARLLANRQDWSNTLIIVYSMRIPYFEAAKIIKDRYPSSKIVNIVPDLPAFMHGGKDPIIRKLLSGFNERHLSKLRKNVDGYVLYSKHMSSYLNLKDDEWIVIEGIYNGSKDCPVAAKDNSGKQRFIYAGGIEEAYGAKNLVEGFLKAHINDAELLFYGSGSYSAQIEELQKDNQNIKYCGLVSPDEMRRIMLSATALINPRPAGSEFTRYSCPSKVIEYMSTGVPVIMTMLEGIPEDYYRYVYTISKDGPDGVAEALVSFSNTDEAERKRKGIQAREYILENKNASKQVSRMIDFATKL